MSNREKQETQLGALLKKNEPMPKELIEETMFNKEDSSETTPNRSLLSSRQSGRTHDTTRSNLSTQERDKKHLIHKLKQEYEKNNSKDRLGPITEHDEAEDS